MTKSERTKAFIIEKIAPVFNTRGFAGTSLTHMTAATGLTKGSIYSNFANKDEVALAVFDYNWHRLQEIIKDGMQKEKTTIGKLLVYAKIYDDFLHHPFLRTGCPVLNTAVEADDTHPRLRKKALGAIVAWKQGLADLIQSGVDRKELKPGVKAEQIAFTIIALIEGGIMISKLTKKKADTIAIRTSLEQLINALA